MRFVRCSCRRYAILPALTGVLGLAFSTGCGAAGSAASLLATPLFSASADTGTDASGGTGGASSFFSGGSRQNTDPCLEREQRKFVRISMRNLAPNEHVHYFLILIAYVNSATYPNGGVCADDVDLYVANGYDEVPDGASRSLGNYCITGPALVLFHESGRFRGSSNASGSEFASAIAPAMGTSATFDGFFNSGGARVPVPDAILFHNPGTGEGAALKVSRNNSVPCGTGIGLARDPDCTQDAFYYVDSNDLQAGSNTLGPGAGRRVPNEIQGSGCECGAFDFTLNTSVSQILAPSGASASSTRCNEFLRGGLIEYTFIRDDRTPPIPQLLWRVSDESGSIAHEFDSRAGIP